MVGGDIVLQLLQRGQSPETIRIVDFQSLTRRDMLEKAATCDYVKADMTSPASVEAAFAKPWPASAAKKPLTVFHTAAMINPSDRSERLYWRIRRVNVDGTVNVIEAAKNAGADIFVATSSASISFLPAELWVWPWQSIPKNYVHIASEADFDAPIRPHHLFFSNCKFDDPVDKAREERADICQPKIPSPRQKLRDSYVVRIRKGSGRGRFVQAMGKSPQCQDIWITC